jgi:glutamate decarboxylase
VLDPKEAMKYIDENTIGVIVIMGSTYTGAFEDVKAMNDLRTSLKGSHIHTAPHGINHLLTLYILVDDLHARTGLDIPIHVDGASGGFIAPFAYPDHEWAFSLSRVNSINASGHKFGMTYPGLGWLLFKDESLLHKVCVSHCGLAR